MIYGGSAAMILGWLVGRALKVNELGVITCLCMAGGGSIFTGLAYLWIGDITVGQDGTIWTWALVGLLGGAIGVAAYIFTLYLDRIVDFCKNNGIF